MSEDGSLFDESDEGNSQDDALVSANPAVRQTMEVPGLYINPQMNISSDIANHLLQCIEDANYFSSGKNQ
ncbi:hypothetical protein CPB86DRAFT_808150, partial [Serendipita vermifera]